MTWEYDCGDRKFLLLLFERSRRASTFRNEFFTLTLAQMRLMYIYVYYMYILCRYHIVKFNVKKSWMSDSLAASLNIIADYGFSIVVPFDANIWCWWHRAIEYSRGTWVDSLMLRRHVNRQIRMDCQNNLQLQFTILIRGFANLRTCMKREEWKEKDNWKIRIFVKTLQNFVLSLWIFASLLKMYIVWVLKLTHRPASLSSALRIYSNDSDGMMRCIVGKG